jgi:plasmid stability protein
MATLYVENVPDELYEALRTRAKQNRRSMAGEVILLLEQHVPTPRELKRRKRQFEQVLKLQSGKSPALGPFPSAEEMIREDRER